MKSTKSTILLIAIATSVLLQSERFLTITGADDAVEAPALGPVSKLTLENSNAESITLEVDSKRLSWGKEPQQRIHSVGYVHIGKALAALLQGESYQEEHQVLNDELSEVQQALAAAFEAMQEKMEGLSPEDPEFEAATQEGQALMQQRDRFLQQANAAKATLSAEQVERAYRELVDAVNVVADRMGIDTVNRFIPTDDPFEFQPGPNAFNQAMLQIRLRSVLRYPEEVDITEEVMEELGIE